MKIKKSLLLLSVVSLIGCAGPSVMLTEGGKLVKVGKSDPYDSYSELGSITAIDGSGCGGFGYRGTYDRAITKLRNKAYHKGADYVQIFTITEPHFEPGCFDNFYKINGALFKKSGSKADIVNANQSKEISGIDKLIKLKSLLDDGAITDAEYKAQKERILSAGL